MNKRNTLFSILINAVIVILESIAVVLSYKEMKTGMFVFYTVLSNIFLGVSSLLVCVFSVPVLSGKRDSLPVFVSRMKYMATCVVTVTFLVVVFILTPTTAGENSIWKNLMFLLLYGSMLYMHFLCPVLAILSYTVFEKPQSYNKTLPLYAMVFTLLYAAVLIPLNIVGKVRGPYPFLMVREQSVLASIIWSVVVLGFAYLIAIGINLASKRH